MNEVISLLKYRGKKRVIVYSTEISGILIEGATTIHYVFKMNSTSKKESVINLLLKETFKMKLVY